MNFKVGLKYAVTWLLVIFYPGQSFSRVLETRGVYKTDNFLPVDDDRKGLTLNGLSRIGCDPNTVIFG